MGLFLQPFLTEDGRGIRVCDGAYRDDLYRPVDANTWSFNGFFRELKKMDDYSFIQTFDDQKALAYHPFDGSPEQGKIKQMTDRNGNTMRFEYDDRGRLSKVIDTLDRDILIAYNPDGFIASVTDFAGRQIRYEYYRDGDTDGSFGDLKSATSPVVTDTPTGNDFPEGKTTTYTYTTGFVDDRLNHNLLTITDGRRNDPNDPTFGGGPYLVNIYADTTDADDPDFDRVIRQVLGGDIIDCVYIRREPLPENGFVYMKTIVNDRNGNVSEHFFDVGNRPVRIREYTGRADPMQPTTESENRPQNKLRAADPDFFETRYEYNRDHKITRIIHPNGNITEKIYEADINPDADPRMRGNLKMIRHRPGSHSPAGDQDVIEERFEYDTDFGCGSCGFNFVTSHIDGRLNETISEYDERGNLQMRTHRISSIIEEFEYNEFGQLTRHTLPDNGTGHRRVDVYTYYTEEEEDDDDDDQESDQEGYLKQEIVDFGNFNLTTTYEYDLVGNVIRKTDPRGHDTRYIVNQLDQVVREISREVSEGSNVRYQKDFFYDANNTMITENHHFSINLRSQF